MPTIERANLPTPPERDPRRIPIRTVSRRAIEALVADLNKATAHAQ